MNRTSGQISMFESNTRDVVRLLVKTDNKSFQQRHYYIANTPIFCQMILKLYIYIFAAANKPRTFQQMGSFLKLKMWNLSRRLPLMGRSAK